jgi:hypothetical protein
MKKNLILASFLITSLAIASAGYAATLSWNLPASHSDGSPIDPHDVRKITVRVYAGSTKTGPWKWVATSLPGATSVMVMDPAPGHTLWYTATATLDGAESEFAEPVRKTNLSFLNVPFAKKVLRKMITPKKMAALFSLLLLGGLAWYFQHRGKKGKG